MEDIDPAQWGGTVVCLRLMARAAVVLRSGLGLVVELDGCKLFAATVADPEDAP